MSQTAYLTLAYAAYLLLVGGYGVRLFLLSRASKR